MTDIQKMEITKESADLKLFLFTVRRGGFIIDIEIPEDFKAIMAYSDKEAVEMVRHDYPAGLTLKVKQRGQISVKKIVDAVSIPVTGQPIQQVKVTTPSLPPVERSKQDFIYGMMYVADKFITNKRDQATLKRIIERLK